MTDAPLIRILEPDDAEAYRAVRLAGIADRPQSFGSAYEEEAARPLADFEARIRSPRPDAIFGAFVGPDLAGVARFTVEPGVRRMHAGFVTGVTVRREFRRRGIAALLLAALIDHARSCVVIVRLGVESSQDEARRLYERAGFRRYGVEPLAMRVDDAYFDEDLMSLDLRTLVPSPVTPDLRHA